MLADLSLFAVVDQKNHSFGAEDCFIGKETEVQRESKFLTYIYFCNQFMAEEGLKLISFKFLLGSESNTSIILITEAKTWT